MNKSGYDQTKEHTEIRRRLNRHNRRTTRQILHKDLNDSKIPALKNTSGWETW